MNDTDLQNIRTIVDTYFRDIERASVVGKPTRAGIACKSELFEMLVKYVMDRCASSDLEDDEFQMPLW